MQIAGNRAGVWTLPPLPKWIVPRRPPLAACRCSEKEVWTSLLMILFQLNRYFALQISPEFERCNRLVRIGSRKAGFSKECLVQFRFRKFIQELVADIANLRGNMGREVLRPAMSFRKLPEPRLAAKKTNMLQQD